MNILYQSVLGVAVALALAQPSLAQNRTDDMRDAFSHIPQTWLHSDEANGFHITYHSPEAARSVGLGRSDARLNLGVASLALTGPAPIIQTIMIEEDAGWPSRIGVAPIDLRHMVAIEAQPVRTFAMQFTPQGTKNTGVTLQANGYEALIGAAGTYYRRGETDYEMNLRGVDRVDPFGGMIGQSSRVAVMGDRVLYSNATPRLFEMMGEPALALADHPDLDRLMSGIDAGPFGDAALLQAMVLSQPLGFVLDPQTLEMAASLPPTPPLGPWSIGLMAELSDGTNDTGLIALSFISAAAAAEAATTLPQTLETYVSLFRQVPLREFLPVIPTVEISATDPRVLLIHMTTPYDPERSEVTRRTNFRSFLEMVVYGDMRFLRPL